MNSILRRKSFGVRRFTLLCLLLFIYLLLGCYSNASANSENWEAKWLKISVSPDGTKLGYPVPGYNEYGEPATELWFANLNGSGKTRVAKVVGYWNVCWFDKNHLAATYFDVNRVPILPISKGKSRNLMITDKYYHIKPAISPDSRWVAFPAVIKEVVAPGIFVLNTSTGMIKQLSKEVVKSHVSWSPDSSKIAYGVGGYQQHYSLRIMDVETGIETDTGLDGVGVEWSPDGKWLAYVGNVTRGSSWNYGIPCDGNIIKTNIETKETLALTEPGVNIYNKETDHWELSGAIDPLWSPDGKTIAYRRIQRASDNDKTTLDKDEIWVVNADGSGRKKLAEKSASFVWSPDSKSLLLKGENAIKRIPLDSGIQRTVVAWTVPQQPPKAKPKIISSTGAVVEYTTNIKPGYAKALLAVADAARKIYADTYGFNMPKKALMSIEKNAEGQTQLWTDGDSQMFLTITSNANLLPPPESGFFNIYGVCHELGHIAMYRSIKLIGIPEGVAEAWPTYSGSVVVDEVYKRLGKNLWPEPYDYSKVEGVARLKIITKLNGNESTDDAAYTNATAAFYEAHKKYGANKVFAAMKTAISGKPYGKDVMPRFVDALVIATGDESARKIFPEEMLVPKVEWNVAEREITDKTVEGLITVEDDTGVLIHYDDGSSDGKLSTSGSGHAVVFKTPPGTWAADYVQMYGSRYGEIKAPNKNFSIYICDQNFEVIKEIENPYNLLNTGKDKWYTFNFEPVKVPEGFYVCIYFDPTANDGFYMNYDKSIKKTHSKSAIPWDHIVDVDGKNLFDWMIRVHLRKT